MQENFKRRINQIYIRAVQSHYYLEKKARFLVKYNLCKICAWKQIFVLKVKTGQKRS